MMIKQNQHFAKDVIRDLKRKSDGKKAAILQRFFKTDIGEYGHGDIFLGINVPIQRQIARSYFDLPLAEVKVLLASKFHEVRLTAVLILVRQYELDNNYLRRRTIYNFYVSNLDRVNNWDLVDLSAPKIIGNYLINKNKKLLVKLSKSKSLWHRRIAVVSTYGLMKSGDLETTLRITNILINDHEDLIHKACGWMLREVGKKDKTLLKKYLCINRAKMPRVMLRYSIEKFNKRERQFFLR